MATGRVLTAAACPWGPTYRSASTFHICVVRKAMRGPQQLLGGCHSLRELQPQSRDGDGMRLARRLAQRSMKQQQLIVTLARGPVQALLTCPCTAQSLLCKLSGRLRLCASSALRSTSPPLPVDWLAQQLCYMHMSLMRLSAGATAQLPC